MQADSGAARSVRAVFCVEAVAVPHYCQCEVCTPVRSAVAFGTVVDKCNVGAVADCHGCQCGSPKVTMMELGPQPPGLGFVVAVVPKSFTWDRMLCQPVVLV